MIGVGDGEHRDADFLQVTQLLPKAGAKTKIFGPLMLTMRNAELPTPLLLMNFLSFSTLRHLKKGKEDEKSVLFFPHLNSSTFVHRGFLSS